MSNIENLYQRCAEYFKDNQERINHLLNVIKNTSEDKWKYHYFLVKEDFNEREEKSTLTYNNVKLTKIKYHTYDYISYGISTYYTLEIKVDNIIVYKTEYEDVLNELDDAIIKMFDKVEEKVKG